MHPFVQNLMFAVLGCRLKTLQFPNVHQTLWHSKCSEAADLVSPVDRCILRCRFGLFLNPLVAWLSAYEELGVARPIRIKETIRIIR